MLGPSSRVLALVDVRILRDGCDEYGELLAAGVEKPI